MRAIMILFVPFIFFLTQTHAQEQDRLSVTTLSGNKQVLILGESYRQPESVNLVSKMVSDYVGAGNCMKVALEIRTDQQDILELAMKGTASISDIEIKDTIDRVAYRNMLFEFSEQIRAGKCLTVHAIYPPEEVPVTKDAWMEQKVVGLMDDKPVLVLVGNPSAIKDFDDDGNEDRKTLAQRLTARSMSVSSLMQYWRPGTCDGKTAQIYLNTEDKSTIYMKEAMGELRAKMPENPQNIADGVLVWGCKTVSVTETADITETEAKSAVKIDVAKYEVVERTEDVLDKIRGGIKHEYPVEGMTQEEAVEALGDPDERQRAGNAEQWEYTCFDSDGFYYTCYILKFKDRILVHYQSL